MYFRSTSPAEPETRGKRTGLWLSLIVATGFTLRLFYLLHAVSLPGFVWDDPDSYMRRGLSLAGEGKGWRWDFDAVRHSVDGRDYALPPLYPVFLSVFALFSRYPFNAQVGQLVLATGAVGLVFVLARQIHSDRAGLLAAAVSAVWLPNVIAVWSTMQEALYVPLTLLGFALLLRAVAKKSSPWSFAVAGLALGLATLTRSMPFYYLPVASFLIWNAKRVGGLWLGFASATVPYSVLLSLHLGQVTFVENHAGIRILQNYGGTPGITPPGFLETAGTLARAFADSPAEVASDWWRTFSSVFHLNGGRLLQIYLGAGTETGAIAWKVAAHVFADFLLTGSLLLAPFGCVACRQPRNAAFLVSWIVVNLGLTVLSGFGGPRLRVPFEPEVIALAAVTLVGGYRTVERRRLVVALAASLGLASILLPQWPTSLKAKSDYGVHWPLAGPPKRSPMTGAAGFNVLSHSGAIEFGVRPRNASRHTVVDVTLEGQWRERVVVTEREYWFHYQWPRTGLVYVELEAKDRASEQPVRMLVIVPAR